MSIFDLGHLHVSERVHTVAHLHLLRVTFIPAGKNLSSFIKRKEPRLVS